MYLALYLKKKFAQLLHNTVMEESQQHPVHNTIL